MMATTTVMMMIFCLILLTDLNLIEAVEMNHENFSSNIKSTTSNSHSESTASVVSSASSCPQDCHCPQDSSSSSGLEETLVNCNGLNLTQPPIPIEDSMASNLRLDGNRIAQIDLVFLKHFPNLKVLNLNQNGLRSLSKSVDSPIFSLEHLDLSGNHLHVIHPYVLSGFPSLKSLNLSNNGLHTVAATAISLPALESLDLSKNALPFIGVHLFETSPKISEINLAYNSLSRLNDGTFGHLTKLSLLDLSYNSLMRIEDNVFVGMNISHLDLSFNNIRKMPSLPLRKLTSARTLILDGNPLQVLVSEALSRVRTEFLSVSKCQNLEQIETGSFTRLPDLKTLTLNQNPQLTYIAPGFLRECPKLAALDLSQNSLYALEYDVIAPIISKLRAIYLNGNHFNCHCSLRWLAELLTASDSPVQDPDGLQCSNNGQNKVLLQDMAGQLSQECEPYILPLFGAHSEALMGRNVSWLCKALGSQDLELYWRLPQSIHDEDPAVPEESKGSNRVQEGQCQQRACVQDHILTVRYLHPSDTGKYTCVAKNKFGQDQRKVHLEVKSEHIQIFPITVASTFVTLSWNTSGALSTGRGYILQVQRAHYSPTLEEHIKQFVDIDVGLKMNSYTVNSLEPGVEYLFELCLRKEKYIIPISSTLLTTRNSGYEVALGIETDYVTLGAVTLILTTLVISCFALSLLRWYTYHHHLVHMRSKSGDSSSQREIIMSPSEHSSVAYPNYPPGEVAIVASSASGDQSRLVEHEVTSPVEDMVGMRETIA